MQFKIYPSIGIARIGNTPTEFFIGPEIPGHPGFERNQQGQEVTIQQYKVDPDEIKRQAARFRIFEIDNGAIAREHTLQPGSTVEWTVHLANKKDAIQRPVSPPNEAVRPQLLPNPASRLIDPGPRTINGAGSGPVKFDTGEFFGRRVPLGELFTDSKQNLLVLGGFGFSSSPTNAPLDDFYTSKGWHDDVSDGPVTARIRLANGTVIDNIEPAWVIVTPPDFAPAIHGVVTLYDILFQIGVDNFAVQPPPQISFTKHIFPMLERARGLHWLNINSNWTDISDDWPQLANPSQAASQLRSENAQSVREIEAILHSYRLTAVQKTWLDGWVAGNFLSDWVGVPVPPNQISASGLTQAALEGAVGQGFFPGIEGGILLTDPTIYSTPFDFRIDHTQLAAGDLTALMAQPWQADFTDCALNWWPSQRPNNVFPSANSTSRVLWDRGANTHLRMIHNFSKLGFITAQKDSNGNIVFVEDQRAPSGDFS